MANCSFDANCFVIKLENGVPQIYLFMELIWEYKKDETLYRLRKVVDEFLNIIKEVDNKPHL